MKNDEQIIELLDQTGHLRHPFGNNQRVNGLSYSHLSLTNPTIVTATASFQEFMLSDLEPLALRHYGRSARCDGDVGPATRELFDLPRCGCADYGHAHADVQAAIGSGNWAGCHGIGDFHAVKAYLDKRGMPSFWKDVWDEVWDNVVRMYDAIGLRWILTEDRSEANTAISFPSNLRGAIGLAIVGHGQTCNSHIWMKILASYKPRDLVWYLSLLLAHEGGHNTGLQHTRGGIMHPSINGSPLKWIGDPSYPVLKRLYGGVPISPVPEPPEPPVPPKPPATGRQGLITWSNGELEDIHIMPRAKVPGEVKT